VSPSAQSLPDKSPAGYRPLGWDTAFFGFPVGRIESAAPSAASLASTLTAAREAGARLLYGFFEPTAELEKLGKRCGGFLADRRRVYAQAVVSGHAAPPDEQVLEFEGAPTEALYALGLAAGVHSRFKVDPRFGRPAFEALYRSWIDNSVTGEFADLVLVIHDDHEAAGALLTLGRSGDRTDIGLLAVKESLRGRGLARRLVRAALARSSEAGVLETQVATQSTNAPACGFYESMGYSIDHEVLVFHFWLETERPKDSTDSHD
jgi:dTDP-4-amino-4,6-dideoxy-D-galactose acyltransferase